MYPRGRHQADRTGAAIPASHLVRSSAGLALAALLGCVAPGTFHMMDGLDPDSSHMHLAVENRYTAPVDVYLRLGTVRIHLLQVPATTSAAMVIPSALAGHSVQVIVWVRGEQPFVSTHDVLLATDTRLELIVSPTDPPLYVVRRS